MKKLINDPADVVAEALRGMAVAHPELRVDHANRIVYRGDAPVRGKVGLISGGGSGHEPLHGGFVGRGMLDAACAGEIFTSPVPDQMLEATKNVDGGAGVLHIVKNYTGDVMNFEMAAELADGRRHYGRIGRDQRRRRGAGQHLHRGAARRRRHGAGGEARRRRRRSGPQPVRGRRRRPPRQRRRAQHGRRADVVHRARRRPSDLRAVRHRDRGGHRHPRRARTAADADAAGARGRRTHARADPGRPRLLRRRRRDPVRQQHGRHPADRAVRHVSTRSRRSWTRPVCRSRARWWAPTSPASTWPAAR